MPAEPAGREWRVRRAGLPAALLTAVVIAGGIAGGIAGAAGGVDLLGDQTLHLGPDAVPVYACPGEQALGALHRGDRVFATALDESGDWVQVRAAFDLDARVWVAASLVVPDRSFDGLAVADSECDVALRPPAATTTPTPTPLPGPTATPTTTPLPGPTTTPTTTPLPGPTTTVPDTSGPTMTGLLVDPAQIREKNTDGTSCPPPKTTTVSVTATDASGVADVTVSWAYEAVSGAKKLTAGAGSFYSTALTFVVSQTQDIVLTVEARDVHDNSTTQTTTVNVRNCS